ncbi:hypothetical protein [Streptomyces sp. NPDC001135]
MSLKVSKLVNRRLRNNALKRRASTWPGVMVTGWGYQGKTETVCEVAAAFEDDWLAMHNYLNPPPSRKPWICTLRWSTSKRRSPRSRRARARRS